MNNIKTKTEAFSLNIRRDDPRVEVSNLDGQHIGVGRWDLERKTCIDCPAPLSDGEWDEIDLAVSKAIAKADLELSSDIPDNDRIDALRREAVEHADYKMARLCDEAKAGDISAMLMVVGAMHYAQSRADD